MARDVRASSGAGRGALCSAVWTMRRFLLCALVFHAFDMATIDPLSAFLYSLVACPAPVLGPDGSCPKGSYLSGGSCEAEPRESPQWSLSAHCADKHYVVGVVTRMKGWLRAVEQAVGIGVLPFAGALADNIGRKPMFIASLSSHVVFVSFLLAACFVARSSWDICQVLLAVGFVACGISNAIYHPTSSAMVADMSRGRERLRGDGYAAFGLVSNLSLVVAFGSMYPVLHMRLEEYSWMWVGFMGLGAGALLLNCWILKETLPSAAEGGPTRKPCSCRRAVSELTKGCRLVWQDPFLRFFVLIASLAPMAVMCTIVLLSAYQVVALEYGNARASITGVVLPIQGAFASAMMSPLIRRSSANRLLLFVLVASAVGGITAGAGAASPSLKVRESCFWVGMSVLSMGRNLIEPCSKTITSLRVAPEHQGNVFACFHLVTSLLHVTVGLLWPEVFFNPRADGLARGAIFLATSGALIICAFGFIALVRATGPPAKDAHSSTSTSSGDESSESDDGVAGSASDEEVSTENA